MLSDDLGHYGMLSELVQLSQTLNYQTNGLKVSECCVLPPIVEVCRHVIQSFPRVTPDVPTPGLHCSPVVHSSCLIKCYA